MKNKIVIIGGGIIGVCITYQLAISGQNVILVEQKEPASGATGAPRGHISLYERMSDWQMPLTKESQDFYRWISEKHDIGYTEQGGSMVLDSPLQLELAKEFLKKCRNYDVKAEVITQNDIHRIQPLLNKDVAKGILYFPEEAALDPFHTVNYLLSQAVKMGAKVYKYEKVTGMEVVDKNIVALLTTKGKIEGDVFVNACGSYSVGISEMAGVPIPLRNHKGMAFVSRPTALEINGSVVGGEFLEKKPLDQKAMKISLGLNKMSNGTIVFSQARREATIEESSKVELEELVKVSRRLLYNFPALKDLDIVRAWSAPTPFTSDGKPIVGYSEHCKNLFHACGFSGALTTAPAIGKMLATTILEETDYKNMEFSPDREMG